VLSPLICCCFIKVARFNRTKSPSTDPIWSWPSRASVCSLRRSVWSAPRSAEMSPLMGSHGLALATAVVAAVSGTAVLLLGLCRQWPAALPSDHVASDVQSAAAAVDDDALPPPCSRELRPCISDASKKNMITSTTRDAKKKNKNKKSVRFAEHHEVLQPRLEEEGGEGGLAIMNHNIVLGSIGRGSEEDGRRSGGGRLKVMPGNRAALYEGMLRDRLHRRLRHACAN
ncbi:hypothetical protein Taro_020545, partial [Colocasia esculenta]|nr:hypothetical protein [Colocasia esculenta]